MNRDGTNREIYTHGVRNSVRMEVNSVNCEIWWTDNEVYGMGDEIPPGEINRQTAKGQHFGFPWFGCGSVRTEEYKDSELPTDTIMPAVETDAHEADLGMMFHTGKMLPDKNRGGIFSAQHGSWTGTDPMGAHYQGTRKGSTARRDQRIFWDRAERNLGRH